MPAMWPVFVRRDLSAPGLVLRAGHSTKTPAHRWPGAGRDLGMHGFLFLVAGGGRYQDALNGRQEVAAGDLWALFPGLCHDYGPGAGQIWHETFIDVGGGLARLFEEQGLVQRTRPVWRPAAGAVAPLLNLIGDIASGRLADGLEAQWRLHGAVLALARDRAGVGGDAAIERARAILDQTPAAQPLDLRRVAAEVGLEWEAFRKRFRRQLGHGPREHRLMARCRQAADLLLQADADCAAVAEAAGFCDASHFGRHFRACLGVSPAAFRRSHVVPAGRGARR